MRVRVQFGQRMCRADEGPGPRRYTAEHGRPIYVLEHQPYPAVHVDLAIWRRSGHARSHDRLSILQLPACRCRRHKVSEQLHNLRLVPHEDLPRAAFSNEPSQRLVLRRVNPTTAGVQLDHRAALAAVYDYASAGDEVGPLRGEERAQVAHGLRPAELAHRQVLLDERRHDVRRIVVLEALP